MQLQQPMTQQQPLPEQHQAVFLVAPLWEPLSQLKHLSLEQHATGPGVTTGSSLVFFGAKDDVSPRKIWLKDCDFIGTVWEPNLA